MLRQMLSNFFFGRGGEVSGAPQKGWADEKKWGISRHLIFEQPLSSDLVILIFFQPDPSLCLSYNHSNFFLFIAFSKLLSHYFWMPFSPCLDEMLTNLIHTSSPFASMSPKIQNSSDFFEPKSEPKPSDSQIHAVLNLSQMRSKPTPWSTHGLFHRWINLQTFFEILQPQNFAWILVSIEFDKQLKNGIKSSFRQGV